MFEDQDKYLPEWMATHIAAIASSYLGTNKVTPDRIPGVLDRIKQGYLRAIRNEGAPALAEEQYAAVDPADSIQDDHLVCLECGAKLKHLTTHLMTNHGLRPDDYRRKWRLDDDYPMTAPASRRKHQLAAQKNLHSRRA